MGELNDRRLRIITEVKRKVPSYRGGTSGLLPDLSIVQWETLLGLDTYNGVTIPETLRPNWDQLEATWWRKGVDAAKCDRIGGCLKPGLRCKCDD